MPQPAEQQHNLSLADKNYTNTDYDYDYGYDDSMLNLCVCSIQEVIYYYSVSCLRGHLHNTIFNLKQKTYVFWFIYMTKAFWGPENKLLKTGLKCNFFGNNTVIISV